APGGSLVTASICLLRGRPSLSGSSLSARYQRWTTANGRPRRLRHSIVVAVELNGPNHFCAAGSLSASARLRPRDTVSRKSFSEITTTNPCNPGHTRVPPSSGIGRLGGRSERQSCWAVDV